MRDLHALPRLVTSTPRDDGSQLVDLLFSNGRQFTLDATEVAAISQDHAQATALLKRAAGRDLQ